jgi:hypothetical protein
LQKTLIEVSPQVFQRLLFGISSATCQVVLFLYQQKKKKETQSELQFGLMLCFRKIDSDVVEPGLSASEAASLAPAETVSVGNFEDKEVSFGKIHDEDLVIVNLGDTSGNFLARGIR